MDLHRPEKPTVFSGEFKDTKLTLALSHPLVDASAVWVRAGCKVEQGACALRILSCSGCDVCVLLHEDLALFGEGQYDVVIMDGCDECGRTPVHLDASCYITSQSFEKATEKRGKRCE